MDLLLENDRWGQRVMTAEETAAGMEAGFAADPLAWHVDRLVGWLRRAGAEPRPALVLCSGPEAKARFMARVGASPAGEVEVVHAPATPADAVHPRIRMHQGDHFNATLYVVDGFEQGDPTPLFEALNRQTGLVARAATWVAVVIESLPALENLARTAPALFKALERRCLVLDRLIDGRDAPGMTDGVEPELLADWRADHRVAELIYQHVMTADTEPKAGAGYDDFGRLVRSGYAHLLTGRRLQPDRQRLVQLWTEMVDLRATGDVPFDVGICGPVVAEAVARQVVRPGGWAALGARCVPPLAEHPAVRYAAGLDVSDVPGLTLLNKVRAAAQGGGEVSEVERAELMDMALAQSLGPNLKVQISLTLAEEAAVRGDLDGCDEHLGAADRLAEMRRGIAPELAFEVAEKMAQMHMYQGRRAQARATLERLLELDKALHSPLYSGLAWRARGQHTAALDPQKARQYYTHAQEILALHGYPEEAAVAAEALEGL